MSDGIALQIVAAVPPAVVAGESHLFTIDVKHDGSRWPYAREEHVLHCIAGASPGLDVQALGPESMVLHRFGGTYGGITYKLTADGTQPSGRLIIKLLNSAGITLGAARLPIEVDIPTIDPPPSAGAFRYTGRAAALIIGARRYHHLPQTRQRDAGRVADAFATWAVEAGGVDPADLFHIRPGLATNAHIAERLRALQAGGHHQRLYIVFSGAGMALKDDVLLLPEDTRMPSGEQLMQFSGLQQVLAPVASELIAFLDLDVTHSLSLQPAGLPLTRPIDGFGLPSRTCTLIGASDDSQVFATSVLAALRGHAAQGDVVTWEDLSRHVIGRAAAVRSYASGGNPVLVSRDDADAADHEPVVDPLPRFTGHYAYFITDPEYVPSAKDELARMLGQRLAGSGVGLVLGSGTRLDSICAEAYVDALGGEPGPRVVSFVDALPDEPEPWTQLVTPGREHRHGTCTRVTMALVLLGGIEAGALPIAASLLGRRILTLPDPETTAAAAIADGIEAVAVELEDMVDTHQWPRPALSRMLAWRALSGHLAGANLIASVIDLDLADDAVAITQLLRASVLRGNRDDIPMATVAWAKDRRDPPELALAMELLVGLRHVRAFTELTRSHDHDVLTAAAELAEMYIRDADGRGFLYSWRPAPPADASASPPLFVDGLPVIGRTQLWNDLRSMVTGDTHTMIVTGEKQSGKTFTLRLVRELVRALGPQHRLIALRLTDARLASFEALLDPYLGPDRSEATRGNAYVRLQRRIQAFIAASPGVVTWLAIDCAGQRTDAELSYLFPGLLGLAPSPDVRLILIDTDFVPGGEDRAIEVRLATPIRRDIITFLRAAYPQLPRATFDEVVEANYDGWPQLLDRIAALDDLEPAASLPEINRAPEVHVFDGVEPTAPLQIRGTPIIGRRQTWTHLQTLARGTYRALFVTGPRDSGKTFTLSLADEFVRQLGPAHRLIAFHLLDGTAEQLSRQLEDALGRPDLNLGPDEQPGPERIQSLVGRALDANPGLTLWFAFDLGDRQPDPALSQVFDWLALDDELLERVRLILIAGDIEVPHGMVNERLSYPGREEIEQYLREAHPWVNARAIDTAVDAARDGWDRLLDVLARIEDASGAQGDPPEPEDETTSAVEQSDSAGDRLATLARQYDEAMRAPGGNPDLTGTAVEDPAGVLAIASDPARNGRPGPGDLRARFQRDDATNGDRMVAIAASSWLGADAPFDLLADALRAPRSVFESRTALRILGELLDTGVWWQADVAMEVVVSWLKAGEAEPGIPVEMRAQIFAPVTPGAGMWTLGTAVTDATQVEKQYRRNCGLPDDATAVALAQWWLPAGRSKPWARCMAVFGSTRPRQHAPRRVWLAALARALGTELVRCGWTVMAANGDDIGDNVVTSARGAGGVGTLVNDRVSLSAASAVPPYAEVVDDARVHMARFGYCAIAIAGRKGTDDECATAISSQVPVLLTDTRSEPWSSAPGARSLWQERGLPLGLLGALDDPPEDVAEYARRIVRLANCVRLAILRDERTAMLEFLYDLPEAELADVVERMGYPAGLGFESLVETCEQEGRMSILLNTLIGKYGGGPEMDRLTTAFGYYTV